MPTETMLLAAGVLVFLAVASAFISALETAFFSLPASRLEGLRARRADVADGVSRMMTNPRRLLSAIIIADALVNAPLMIGSLALIEGQRGLDIPFWASAMLLFALIVFACDLVPKLIGIGAPMLVVRLGVSVFGRVLPLIDPMARVLERISEKVADTILPKGWTAQRSLTEDEIDTLVEMSASEGTLHDVESEMISEIIKLGDKTAKDCMTPRVDMFSLPDDLTNEEVATLVRQRRLRRVPVHGETPDEIEGVLDVAAFLRDPQVPYTELLGVPSFVPETMKALTLLKSFLSHPQGIAFVVDEHGGVEGIVTLRDLVEEIISDAVPRAEAKLYIEDAGEGRLLASGSARLEDIEEELGVGFDEEGIDTIGGLIFNHLGHLPRKGQEIRLGELHVTVRRVSRKRVDEVLLKHEPVAEEDASE
jgi:CBS domain containing-hemolysin-like protein